MSSANKNGKTGVIGQQIQHAHAEYTRLSLIAVEWEHKSNVSSGQTRIYYDRKMSEARESALCWYKKWQQLKQQQSRAAGRVLFLEKL